MQIFEAVARGLELPRNPGGPFPGHPTPPAETQLEAVLEAARWGASPYNMQPWCFLVLRTDARIRDAARTFSADAGNSSNRAWVLCLLDRTRMLPVADPCGTEPYISLGTVCLNVQAASAALGLTCKVWGPAGTGGYGWRPDGIPRAGDLEPYYLFEIGDCGGPPPYRQSFLATYRLDSFQSKPIHAAPPPLRRGGMETFACIRARQSDRVPMFRNPPWAEDSVRILSEARRALDAHRTEGVQLLLVENPQKTMALTLLQEQAWRRATAHRGRFREMCDWLRFTEREWRRRGDGEFVDHLGLTGWRKTLARIGLQTALAPVGMSLGAHRFLLRRAEPSPKTTGAFLTAVLENPDGRFEADETYRREVLTGTGAAIQALWLTATALGASLQFQTSTIVQDQTKAALRRLLDIPAGHEPLFLVRTGYPQRDPHYANIRRKAEEVIVQSGPERR